MGHELTTANKILVAAMQMGETQETFTAEDLIVRVWQQYPESFGLSGYRERYPDSNRVLSKLMGSVGLCSRGWLEQVSTKTYRMTPAGRKLATALRTNGNQATQALASERRAARAEASVSASAPDESRATRSSRPLSPVAPARTATQPSVPPRAPAARVSQPAVRAPVPTVAARPSSAPTASSDFQGLPSLQRLATSVANQKFARGSIVSFQDACQFWSISQALPAAQVQTRLTELEQLLKRAEQYIQRTGVSIRVHDRLEVTLTTVVGLQGLNSMLTQRFRRELESLRGKSSRESGA